MQSSDGEESDSPEPELFKFDVERSRKVVELIKQRQKSDKGYLMLKVQLNVAPELPGDNQYRDTIPLAHDLYPENAKICLVVKDNAKNIDNWKPHCTILPLKEYRKRTKGALKRRKFISEFDILLADARIAQSMRTNFGKEVYRSKKVPHCVRLQSKNVDEIINIIRRSTQMIFSANRTDLEVSVRAYVSDLTVLI